jgi:cytochrome c
MKTCLVIAAALCGLLAATQASASMQLAIKAGCMTCHQVDKKLIGPAIKDIAAKYKGRADAMAFLTQRVRKGGPGSWGPMPMTPTDVARLSDADLKTLLTWMLKTP